MVNSDWYGNFVMCSSVETVPLWYGNIKIIIIIIILLTNNSTTSKGKFNTILSGIVGFCNRWCCCLFFLYHSCFAVIFLVLFPSMTWHGKARKIKIQYIFFHSGICDGKQKKSLRGKIPYFPSVYKYFWNDFVLVTIKKDLKVGDKKMGMYGNMYNFH